MKQNLLRTTAAVLLLCSSGTEIIAQTRISETWNRKVDQSKSDYATAIWTNKYGESYLSGNSYTTNPSGAANSSCIMLTKINTTGNVVWTKNIFVPADYIAMNKGITGDGEGNIYVQYQEKYQYTDTLVNRVVISKFSPSGNVIWQKHITPYVNGLVEEARDREFIYSNGKLYFCGSTFKNTGSLDAFLYKVDAGTGNADWRSIYNGPLGSDDIFHSVHVGPAGNVWAVGRSRGLEGPGGIYSDYDVAVGKYNANGQLQWMYKLNGSGNSDDIGINITVDKQGNCYHSSQVDVLGMNSDSVVIEKLSPAGQRVWRYGFIGSNTGSIRKQPIMQLPSGDIVVSSCTVDGITTFALNAATGTQLWRNAYSRAARGASDYPAEMISDSLGNIYIAGTTRDSSGSPVLDDITTLKYNSTGVLQWYAYYTEPHRGSQETGRSLALDGALNVYTIGFVQDSLYNNDFFLLKYGTAIPPQPPVTTVYEIGADKGVIVYPNPGRDLLHVKTSAANQVKHLVITDYTGKVVWTTTTREAEIVMQAYNFSSGIYLLQCRYEDGVVKTTKLVIAK
ncbi:MAG TPA: T9SS type A sorting domain-containing protein [Flavipsychrobacter sp.]